ncbi:BrnT family toxin [Zavarzinia sp.]|uniref:BrnT family toxin n=1 Tax=Zavarzinia sp. TaxID=2027920 RepID=UPI003BB5C3B3
MEQSTIFDWNDAKAEINAAKHGITFPSAARVFLDARRVIVPTIRAEDGEDRFKVVGAIEGKLYVVVFTMRGDICWLISARRTNTQEDRIYGPLQT